MHWSLRFWQKFYDLAAPFYDTVLGAGVWLGLGSEERIRREVIGKLIPEAGAVIIDVGCGTAASRSFLPADVRYIGVDISHGMLNRARAKCRKSSTQADLIQADAAALPLHSAHGDRLIAMGILQHVNNIPGTFKELERVAKDSGEILIIDERRSQNFILGQTKNRILMAKHLGEYFIYEFRKP